MSMWQGTFGPSLFGNRRTVFPYSPNARVWVQESATRKGVWQTIYRSGKYSDHKTLTDAECEAAEFELSQLDSGERREGEG
jgi:hypothetical protein